MSGTRERRKTSPQSPNFRAFVLASGQIFMKLMTLNIVFLKNRLQELGLKQWWLAEQMGVDRKTVSRWVQGQVRSIQLENAQTLANILQCKVEDLSVVDESQQLASIVQQKQAAEMLLDSSIVEKLGPLGEWNVIESLLKAVVVPNLPENVLGELYNQLCVASWRQSKMAQAKIFNHKAEEIGQKTGDKELIAKALLSKANLLSWDGQVQAAVTAYRECLTYSNYIEEKTVGAIHSNLGAVLYEAGYVQEGRPHLDKAIKIFEFHGRPMNLSIAWGHMARVAILEKHIEQAEILCQKSIEFAKVDDYKRGLEFGHLLRAEIFALQGRREEALVAMNLGLHGFSAQRIVEALNFEIAGRVQRLCGNLSESEALLQLGVECGQGYPLYLARVFQEMALTLNEAGQTAKSKEYLKKATDLLEACGAR